MMNQTHGLQLQPMYLLITIIHHSLLQLSDNGKINTCSLPVTLTFLDQQPIFSFFRLVGNSCLPVVGVSKSLRSIFVNDISQFLLWLRNGILTSFRFHAIIIPFCFVWFCFQCIGISRVKLIVFNQFNRYKKQQILHLYLQSLKVPYYFILSDWLAFHFRLRSQTVLFEWWLFIEDGT